MKPEEIRPGWKYRLSIDITIVSTDLKPIQVPKGTIVVFDKDLKLVIGDIPHTLMEDSFKYISMDKRLLTAEQKKELEGEGTRTKEVFELFKKELEKGKITESVLCDIDSTRFIAFGSLIISGVSDIAGGHTVKSVELHSGDIVFRASGTSVGRMSPIKVEKLRIMKDKYEFILAMVKLNDSSMARKFEEMPEKERRAKLDQLFTKPIWLEKVDSGLPVKPLSPAFGYEIELSDGDTSETTSSMMRKLREHFNTSGDIKDSVEIDLGNGQKLSILKDKYQMKEDVVKIYEDCSVGYEIVTRPFRISEMESRLKPIYDGIKKIMSKPKFKSPHAGGHITMMDGNNMDTAMHPLVVSNMVQLTRAFFPQILMLSGDDGMYRGTQFYNLNSKQSAQDYTHSQKYSVINKRVSEGNVTGLEMRSFRSPPNAVVCEDNAKIMLTLWKVAEELAIRKASISIAQIVVSLNKAIQTSKGDRKLFEKKALYKIPGVKALSRTFLGLVKTEASKLGILEEIERRLLLTKPEKVSITPDEFIAYTNAKIKEEDILKVLTDKFGSKRAKLVMKELGGN